ncbi:MAG: hypothetical protein JWQ71_2561 [Pedosphaera sp.]|nr:hypothetical protein [Pedosphaera sp.]
MNRRQFIKNSTAATLWTLTGAGCATTTHTSANKPLSADQELILAGTKGALEKSLYPALRERAYPGHFMVTVDGGTYGSENTWPGLDSWEIAGAFLLTGRRREVLDYFDFVQASQRKDGNIPFAIFPGDQSPGSTDSWLRGLRFPEDVYTYKPTVRLGQPDYSNMNLRKWVGLFTHWQMKANPLSVLGATSYILIGSEIFAETKSKTWLTEKIDSLEAAGKYLLSRIAPNGLMSGAGFYIESPPRNQWDGITQCYGIYVFRQLAAMNRVLGRREARSAWLQHADKLSSNFIKTFWQHDHFAEYVHPEHGLVDSHGLSDVNWAAIGLGIATRQQTKILWPILKKETAFWRGNFPTHLVTKPGTYQKWEFAEPLPFAYNSFTHDVAAMGRVWYLEALACKRMGDHQRLRESAIKVCELGKLHDWRWAERYHAGKDNTVNPAGAYGYCEYAAILVRVVLSNPEAFPEAKSLRT